MIEGSLHHEPRFVGSFDGTQIAVRRMGAGSGVPLLVVPSIGAGLSPWRRTLRPLVNGRTVVTWDLRGEYASERPRNGSFEPGAHAEDAFTALASEGIERVDVATWSTGVPIAIELAAREPERVRRVALVSGGYGHTLRRLFRYLELTSALPVIAGVAKHFSGPLQGVVQRFAARPELSGIARQSGFMAPTVDLPAFVEMLRGMADNDLNVLLRTYEQVIGGSVYNRALAIHAPTLLVVGDRDQFVPLRMVEGMRRVMPDARLEIYEGATHFLPFEQPERLADDLAAFYT